MFNCKDPTLTYLNGRGYNVVGYPRSGILPLDVLGKQGKSKPQRLGTIGDIWKKDGAPPTWKEDAGSQIEGQSTKSLKVSVGITLLQTFLAAFGLESPEIRSAYQGAKKLQFSFTKPKVLGIAPLVVADYMTDGDIDVDNALIKFFVNDDYSAYIITEVLQSKSISVTAQDELETGVDVDLGTIEKIAKASGKVVVSAETTSHLTYKGQVFLTFGYKAFKIAFIDGKWDLDRVPTDEKNAMLTAGKTESIAGPVLEPELSLL
jgi:hypothetical protein